MLIRSMRLQMLVVQQRPASRSSIILTHRLSFRRLRASSTLLELFPVPFIALWTHLFSKGILSLCPTLLQITRCLLVFVVSRSYGQIIGIYRRYSTQKYASLFQFCWYDFVAYYP